MAKLTQTQRANLPNTAFAYIDSSGRRRLPIHDEAHVRNALARFNRVAFEDDASRERARKKLLTAAKRYGIVPIGFITGELEAEGVRGEIRARSTNVAQLPVGVVTFIMTDIEDSTALLRQLGDRYADVLDEIRRIVRQAVRRAGGVEVDARADEFFGAFERPRSAVEAAVAVQRKLEERSWPSDVVCRLRIGIHTGRPTLTTTGYIGLAVHTVARISAVANGGQVVVSGDTKSAIGDTIPDALRFRSLGRHRLAGMTRTEALFQVEADGLRSDFPALRRRRR